MGKCVGIEANDDGTFSVGECDPQAEAQGAPETPEDKAGDQQFQNIDEALQAAKVLLAGDDGGKAQARNEIADEVWPQKQSPLPKGMA